MFWLIFTLIYIVSFAIHIAIIYLDCKRYLYFINIGDIIDGIRFYMWCPIINTAYLIILAVYFIFVVLIKGLIKLTKLDNLWEKFRNIKIKK